MSAIIARAINENQLLLLKRIKENSHRTVTGLLSQISKVHFVALSTLKLNLKVLKRLELIAWERGTAVKITEAGDYILNLLENNNSRLAKGGAIKVL